VPDFFEIWGGTGAATGANPLEGERETPASQLRNATGMGSRNTWFHCKRWNFPQTIGVLKIEEEKFLQKHGLLRLFGLWRIIPQIDPIPTAASR